MKYIYILFLMVATFSVSAQTTTYDELNRPISVEYEDGSIVTYQWDSAGNPTTRMTLRNPLPTELLEFIGWPETLGGNVSQLKWVTPVGQNIASFTVQWSIDGTNWTDVTSINAVGNGSVEQTYTTFHTEPIVGNNYYRLNILNANEYSNIVVVTFEEPILTPNLTDIGEVKTVAVNHGWKTIPFNTRVSPIVIALPSSRAGEDFFSVEIKNIQSNSCRVRVREAGCHNYLHVSEQITILVIEQGIHEIDGYKIIADKVSSIGNSLKKVNYASHFESRPGVIATPETSTDFGILRAKTPYYDCKKSVYFKMQGAGNTYTGTTTVNYVAFENNASGYAGTMYFEGFIQTSVNHNNKLIEFEREYGTTKNVLAFVSTIGGSDPIITRVKDIYSNNAKVAVQEDICSDVETAHGGEYVSIIRWGNGAINGITFPSSEYRSIELEEQSKIHIKVYPNPTKDELNVSVVGDRELTFMGIFDMSGQQVINSVLNQIETNWIFDVSSLPSGAYIISFKSNNKVVSSKFVKQ